MPTQTYEAMILFDTNKVSGNIDGAAENLIGLLNKHNCEVIAHRVWDEKRLAYPIGNQKKGTYYLLYMRTEGGNLNALHEDLRLLETVLRYLITKVHDKWVEPLLEVTHDNRATCLRLMGDDLDDSATRHAPRTGPAAVPIKESEPETKPEEAPAEAEQTA